jgi:hypothetical protein
MKKTALLVALALGISQIYAQGFKVDANMSNFSLKHMSGVKSKMGFGVTVGSYTKIMFSENFGFQPELLLHYKHSKWEVKAPDEKTNFQYFGLEIPVYAVLQTNIGNCKGFLGIGPYLGFGIDARYKTGGMSDLKVYKKYDKEKSYMQRFDLGAGFMLGCELSDRLQIAATYKLGFIDALKADRKDATMLNRTISLGLGFRF